MEPQHIEGYFEGGWPAFPLLSFFFQRLLHFDGQVLLREWLLDEIDASIQHTPVDDWVSCITGHKQNFHAGVKCLR